MTKNNTSKEMETNKSFAAKNTVISPNFLVVNFVERHSFRNCAFPKKFPYQEIR